MRTGKNIRLRADGKYCAAPITHKVTLGEIIEENVSTKVVKIIQSYTGIVDKMVWRKF